MQHQLTIELPDELYQHLLKWSQQTGETPEAWATDWLTGTIQRLANDPLLQLAGTVESEVTNVSEHIAAPSRKR